VITAESDDEARYLASTNEQAFVALRTGTPGRMKPPIRNYRDSLPDVALAMLDQMRSVSAIGSPETVREGIVAFVARTQADEIIISGSTYDPDAQIRSVELTMAAVGQQS